MPNYREEAGLPNGNSGEYLAEGVLTDWTGVVERTSLPLHGHAGGLPELVVPDPASQIAITAVHELDPPY